MQQFKQIFWEHICRMLNKYISSSRRHKIKYLVANLAASLLLASAPSSYAGYAELGPSMDIQLEVDSENKKRFYNIYNKSIIRPLKDGEPVKIDVAKPITSEEFFRSQYCYQIGEYLLSSPI